MIWYDMIWYDILGIFMEIRLSQVHQTPAQKPWELVGMRTPIWDQRMGVLDMKGMRFLQRCPRFSRPSWVLDMSCGLEATEGNDAVAEPPELWYQVWTSFLEWDTNKHSISPQVQTLQTFRILESRTLRSWLQIAKVATADKPPALLASVLAGTLN